MMPNDLSARLRAAYEWATGNGMDFDLATPDLLAAADMIDQQAAEIERLQTALAAVRGAGWQPMETAPKDGTPILTFDGVFYQVVSWGHRKWIGNTPADWGWAGQGVTYLPDTFICWMPIPPTSETKP